jgi:hypothetical protein
MIDREPPERDRNGGRKREEALLRHLGARSSPRSFASRAGTAHAGPSGAVKWEMSENVSTAFSHQPEVGVKCKIKRRWRANRYAKMLRMRESLDRRAGTLCNTAMRMNEDA